jgi:hypothetical protein
MLAGADEAIKIEMRHIQFEYGQADRVILTLDFRKTVQGGGAYFSSGFLCVCIIIFI